MKTGVSIIIPSYNGKKMIFRLLDSIKRSSYPNIETIVVDNGSEDGTLSDGNKKYQWVKWIDAGKINIGQTGCYNVGFAHAKKENNILYCDADVVLDKDMITKLLWGSIVGYFYPLRKGNFIPFKNL